MPGFVTPVVEGRAGTVENAEEQELAQAAAENRRAHEAAAGGSTAPPASSLPINPLQDDGRTKWRGGSLTWRGLAVWLVQTDAAVHPDGRARRQGAT